MTHRIEIDPKPRHRDNREPEFTVSYNGAELLRSSEPFYASCRALVNFGKSGTLEMYGPGLRMSGDIEKGAKLTVKTPDLRLTAYKERERFWEKDNA